MKIDASSLAFAGCTDVVHFLLLLLLEKWHSLSELANLKLTALYFCSEITGPYQVHFRLGVCGSLAQTYQFTNCAWSLGPMNSRLPLPAMQA